MVKNFDEFQKLSKDSVDATLKSFGAVSKNTQAIAVELADYSKKSFEQNTAVAEKLFGAKSLDKAIEIQSDHLKSSYETYMSEAAKLSELFSELAKETYKPFEAYWSKASVVAK